MAGLLGQVPGQNLRFEISDRNKDKRFQFPNVAKGLLAGTAGIPSDILQMVLLAGNALGGAAPELRNDPVAEASRLSEFGVQPQQNIPQQPVPQVPLTSDKIAGLLGANPERADTMLGLIGAPDPRDIGKLAALGILSKTSRAPLPPRISAGDSVSGLEVSDDIKNSSSIRATFGDDFDEVGVRSIPISEFSSKPTDLFYAKDDIERVGSLAEEIKKSGRIDPLIAVQDSEGFYILEGGHRLGALDVIGADSVPALVVRDLESLNGR